MEKFPDGSGKNWATKGLAMDEAFFFRLVVELRFEPLAGRDADFLVGIGDLLSEVRTRGWWKQPMQKNSPASLMGEEIDEGKVRQACEAPILLEASGGLQSL
jgi:hypothetical protein